MENDFALVETIKIRGLVRLASWVFVVWGGLIFVKSIYDLIWGEPDANLYSPAPWMFVTREQWLRYSSFELIYGLACCSLAYYLYRYARFLPETVKRHKQELELDLFK